MKNLLAALVSAFVLFVGVDARADRITFAYNDTGVTYLAEFDSLTPFNRTVLLSFPESSALGPLGGPDSTMYRTPSGQIVGVGLNFNLGVDGLPLFYAISAQGAVQALVDMTPFFNGAFEGFLSSSLCGRYVVALLNTGGLLFFDTQTFSVSVLPPAHSQYSGYGLLEIACDGFVYRWDANSRFSPAGMQVLDRISVSNGTVFSSYGSYSEIRGLATNQNGWVAFVDEASRAVRFFDQSFGGGPIGYSVGIGPRVGFAVPWRQVLSAVLTSSGTYWFVEEEAVADVANGGNPTEATLRSFQPFFGIENPRIPLTNPRQLFTSFTAE